MTATVFEGLDRGGDFQDPVADGRKPIGLVGFGEELGLDDAGPVGDGDELHRFTGGLVEKALFDDEAAGDDLPAEKVAEAVDGAIRVPGDIGKQFERMAAGRITEQLLFGAETREARGLGKAEVRRPRSERNPKVEIRRINAEHRTLNIELRTLNFGFRISDFFRVSPRPFLVLLWSHYCGTFGKGGVGFRILFSGCQSPEIPVLHGAGLAEEVEGPDANKRFHFFGERLDAEEEIGKGSERSSGAFAENGVLRAVGEAFYEKNGDAEFRNPKEGRNPKSEGRCGGRTLNGEH